MNITKQVIILSAELSNLSNAENLRRTETLRHCLEDLDFSFSDAVGSYKGEIEESFVVIVNDQTEIDTLKDFAFKNFNQETVLYQDGNGYAHLIESNATQHPKLIGRLSRVSKDDAFKAVRYTMFNEKYYTAV